MKSAEYDLRFLSAGIEELENYLLSSELFWNLGIAPPAGEPDYPQLTLDWLLLTATRVRGRDLTGEQRMQADREITALEAARTRWRVAWERKASQCFQLRGRMWRDYLQEYQENTQDNADRYAYEVRLRVMLELLRGEFQLQRAEGELLSGLDSYLKNVLVPGNFIWEAEVRAGFAPDKYWYLYGELPFSTSKNQAKA